MAHVIVYTTEHCPYCKAAKDLLNRLKVGYDEIRVDVDDEKRREMMEKSGRRTVPQIFINNSSIGGYDDLSALAANGKLNELLK